MKNEYLSYDALQLAAEPSFIRWIKEDKGPLASTWQSWLVEHPTMQPIVDEASEIVRTNLAAIAPLSHTVDASQLWKRIETTIDKQAPQAKVRNLKPLYIALSLAAAIAILFLINPFSPTETQVKSLSGQHTSYWLPDSSNLELNAASSIRFAEKGFRKKREVFLQGEAFFEVQKGESFVVKTEQGLVKVLGTSFNVFQRAGHFEVQCLTGKVQVQTRNESDSVILLPGETCSLTEEGTLIKGQSELPELATWRQHKFLYTDTPLIEVVEEIKRQFNVKIDFQADNIMDTYTGSFEGKNLEKTLEDVLWPMKLQFEITGNTILVKEEKP